MTPFMKSVLEAAAKMVELTKEEYTGSPYMQGGPDWEKLERRFACVIVQSRAAECRQISTNLIVKIGGQEAVKIARDLSDRSHLLESLAMKLATGPWPPDEETTKPVDIKSEIIVQ